tara:strand:+ start:397 stop:633 length:237 start_codon:yes stop_codon:yes gene_type:complete
MSLIQLIRDKQKKELLRLVDHFGSQYMLAKELGVSKQVVNGWTKRGRISATGARKIDKLLHGVFKKEDLRPDVYNWDK